MTAARCSGAEAMRRARLVAAARGWIGTPYLHQASAKGRGADCLGLVRGVWRDVVGPEPEAPPAYSPDWSEPSREERLWRACARWLREVPVAEAGPGDVLLFRMRDRGVAKHLGVLTEVGPGDWRMVHAHSGRCVAEVSVGPSWRRRIVSTFRFPG